MRLASVAVASKSLSCTRLAVLDIDGTLYDGTLGIDLLKELARARLFEPSAMEKIGQAMAAHERGELSRDEVAARVYALYGQGIAGLTREQLAWAASTAWERNKHRVFAFVPELLKLLAARGYTPVVMTGSPREVVRLLTHSLGVEHLYAADFETAQGRYTGRLSFSPGRRGHKRATLLGLARELGADLETSLVLGDSENDFDMFDRVGVSIAMNPKGHLAALVQEHGWKHATPETLLPALRQWLPDEAPGAYSGPARGSSRVSRTGR